MAAIAAETEVSSKPNEPSQAWLGFATLRPPTRPYSKGIHGCCGFMMMQPSSPTAQMS